MFGDARRAVLIGGLVVFGSGFLIGLAVGRAGDDDPRIPGAAPPPPSVTVSPTTPPVVTPSPGQEPAIPTQQAILREGGRLALPVPAGTGCQGLVTPGALGECGEVTVADTRVIWVIERSATAAGADAISARVFTFVPDAGGWVEWLQAADPTGERWSDVNVFEVDLTGDGVSELVVGFRETDEAQTLGYDIVGYGQDNLPVVLAHPDPAPLGVVVASGGAIQDYAAQYPGGEPACCPASYLQRTIVFEDGFFRVASTDEIAPTSVPTSQL